MSDPQHQVFEILSEGLPVAVGVCRAHERPRCGPGETVRVLLSHLSAPVASRLAGWRLATICEWATGEPTKAPEWLRSRVPIPPPQRGRGHGRPVVRVWPDGHVEAFASVWRASRAVGRDPVVLRRRLGDGRADCDGCTWHDRGQIGTRVSI
jgi:hypothetical protein